MPPPPTAALASDLCKGAAGAGAGLPQTLLVLAHLAATQPHLAALPDPALRQLSKVGLRCALLRFALLCPLSLPGRQRTLI